MSLFGDMVDFIFSDDDLADDGVYTPNGGSPISVRVIINRPDIDASLFQSDVIVGDYTADIRYSELSVVEDGAELSVGSDNYTVISPSIKDSKRLVWTMGLRSG